MKDLNFSRWRPHPWHGLDIGPNAPRVVIAYIEITPFDMIKYEIDKASGYLMVDRPQRSSSHPPALYGFIPRTYCSKHVAALAPGCEKGDGDPLDICVVSERPIERSEVLLRARVVGGQAHRPRRGRRQDHRRARRRLPVGPREGHLAARARAGRAARALLQHLQADSR
jgi:hypothetical protein